MEYITIDGDDIGRIITASYLNNDLDALLKINQVVKDKTTLIADFLKSKGFEIIFCAADGVAGYTEETSVKYENIFESIKTLASPELSFSAGVGTNLQESYIALLSAKSSGKCCLQSYSSLK